MYAVGFVGRDGGFNFLADDNGDTVTMEKREDARAAAVKVFVSGWVAEAGLDVKDVPVDVVYNECGRTVVLKREGGKDAG